MSDLIILPTGQIELNDSYIDKCEGWEDFCSLAITAREVKDLSQWYLGKIALRVEKKYGEDSIGKFAKEIGIQQSSLEVYRWVVSQYLKDNPQFAPIPKIAFSVYRAVAKLPSPEREALLKQADEGDYSVERVRLEKDRVAHPERKQRPRYTLRFCEIHSKWIFQPQNPLEFESLHE